MRLGYLLLIGCALAAGSSRAEQYQLDRVEPPSWWIGMASNQLQLMLHGEHIAALTPQSDSAGVRLRQTHRTTNPNYLFVDLELLPGLAAGTIPLRLVDAQGQEQMHIEYPVEARAADSAQRRGFGPADAIYLVVPDRFANGNPDNDSVEGVSEGANRSDPNGRHGGDLAGMRGMLDYVAQMGFTQIWSTPLVVNDQPAYSYHGYAATDLYRIDPRFGSNAEYRQFVHEASERGIGVIQDIVLNHIGSQHWWMSDLPAPDWINSGAEFAPTNHARTTLQDPYAAESDRRAFSDGWFVSAMPDLNQRHPLLATYLIQNSLWWIEYSGISGIREDTYSYADPSFLSQWSQRLLAEYPQFSIVGEEWSRNPLVVSYWQSGNEQRTGYRSSTPSMMDFPLYYALIEALVEEQSWDGGVFALYQALVNDRLYAAPQRMVLFEGNHDTSRLFSLLGEDLGRYRAAMVYLLTVPRIPQLFYGTEILMTSPQQRDDGRLRADFPGGWAGDSRSAVTGLGLSTAQKDAQALLRKLLNWRKSSAVIARGAMTHFVPVDGVYVYFRHSGDDIVMVVLNCSGQPRQLDPTRFDEVLNGRRSGREVGSDTQLSFGDGLVLPAASSWVIEVH